MCVGGGKVWPQKDFMINLKENVRPDWVSNPVPPTPQSDALPTALRSLASEEQICRC